MHKNNYYEHNQKVKRSDVLQRCVVKQSPLNKRSKWDGKFNVTVGTAVHTELTKSAFETGIQKSEKSFSPFDFK